MKEHYFPFVNKSRRTVVGLMSGTSVDGIDAAVVSIEGQGENISVDVHAFFNTPFDTALRKRIFDAFNPKHATVDILGSLNMELAEAYAKAALHAIHASGLKTDDIDLICSHGQTVYHQPIAVNGQHAFSVQLGDGNVIAQRTGILCMTDFRIADIAAGGQGAPLVPYTEFLLYRSENESVLLQNIGGIANITVLPAGCTAQDVTAFDTGPGNMVIDALVSKITQGKACMDIGGKIASEGKVHEAFLQTLSDHAYFSEPTPKTTGRELFGVEYTEQLYKHAQQLHINDKDLIATATCLTAKSIAIGIRDCILPTVNATRLIVGGGGSYNTTLLTMLKEELLPLGICVQTQEELGYSSDAKEAIAFALLGDCSLRGVPSAVPSVTGARYASILGKLSFPCTIQ